MKVVYLLGGWLSFGLGILGIFLPLLPTTPFMLLAAFCFSRGSPRLHQWLLHSPHLGPAIKDWNEKQVIRTKAKVLATLLLVPTILAATVLSRWPLPVNIFLVLIVSGVLAFLWTRNSR